MALVTRFCTTCCKRTLSPQTGQEAVRLRPEGNPFLGGFALAGGADGGGGFVQGHPVLIEQHLLLLELGRQKKVFRQTADKSHPLLQGRQQGRRASGASARVSSPLLTANSGLRRS